MSLYSFTGPTNQNQTQAAGIQQYLQQGQLGINPGQMNVAASDPIAAAAQGGFGQALQNAGQNIPPGMFGNSGPSMQQQAQQPGGMNMGLFNTYLPAQQNQDNPTATPGNVPQPSWMQQLGNYLSGS